MFIHTAKSTVLAAATYYSLTFAFAFLLGSLRVTFLVPWLDGNELLAVLIELPLVIAFSLFVLFTQTLQSEMRDSIAPIPMGVLAFSMLMISEYTLSLAMGNSSEKFFNDLMHSAPQQVGFAAQILFGLFPILLYFNNNNGPLTRKTPRKKRVSKE